MKDVLKRVLSFALALVMVLSMVPDMGIHVHAHEADETISTEPVEPVTETEPPAEETTEAPTEAPTEEPTEETTSAPTEEPTEGPTEAPSSEPTEETTVPSKVPVIEETEPTVDESTEPGQISAPVETISDVQIMATTKDFAGCTVADLGISATDATGTGNKEGPVCTWTASGTSISGSLRGAKGQGSGFAYYCWWSESTTTLTLKNNKTTKAYLSFQYDVTTSGSAYGDITVNGTKHTQSATNQTVTNLELAAGETITIKLHVPERKFAYTYPTQNGASITIRNISLVGEGEAIVNFEAAENGGSYTVTKAGTAVTVPGSVQAKSTDQFTMTATPASDDYVFTGWYNVTTGKYLSADLSFTTVFEEDVTITAHFIKKADGIFGLYDSSNILKAAFTDLTAAAQAAANSSIKTVVLMKNATVAGNHTIPAGVTLLIPKDTANTPMGAAPESSTGNATPTAFRTLTLDADTKIRVNGNIEVEAAHTVLSGGSQRLYGGRPDGAYGAIYMNSGSNITLNSGATLYAWGYVYGNGSVTVESGAKVYEYMQVTDFPGGSNLAAFTGNDAIKSFPFSQYYVQNVEVPMTLKAGATEYVYLTIYVSSTSIGTAVEFIGSKGMFVPTSGSITKDYDESRDRLVIDVDGKASVSSIVVDMSGKGYDTILNIAIGSTKVDSANYILALNSNITVNANAGTTISIAQDVALFPGVEVYIDQEATMVLEEGDSSNLTVEGSGGRNVYAFDMEQWGNRVFSNAPLIEASYSPTSGRYKRTAGDLKDALIDINGTVIADGFLYSTVTVDEDLIPISGGAEIISSEKTGQIIMQNGAGQEYETYCLNGTSSANAYVDVISVWLKNGEEYEGTDNAFLETEGAVAGTTYDYCATHDQWYTGECAKCAHTHVWGDASYVWTGTTACTATRNCSADGCYAPTETAQATISSKVKTAATCTVMGTTTYTATFTETWATTQTKDVQDIATIAHSYTTKVSGTLAIPAKCEAAATYYVQCDNCTAVSDTLTVASGTALGHKDENTDHSCDRNCGKADMGTHADSTIDKDHVCDYGCGATLEDCSDVTGDNDHKCDVCQKDNVSEHDWAAATCTAPKTCSECKATEGSALDHAWGDPSYTANQDGKTHTATYTCTNDGSHTKTEQGNCADDADGNHTCDLCGAANITACSGGTATCTAPATCEECGQPYGSVDADNHTQAITYVNLETEGHKAYYPCCQTADSVEAGKHNYDPTTHECVCEDVETFTITFKRNAADEDAYHTITQAYGSEVAAPVNPTRDGYTFNGWLKDGVSYTLPATMPGESFTLIAAWTINEYTVKFYNGDNYVQSIFVEHGSSAVYSGPELTKAADDANHYAFAGWTTTEGGTTVETLGAVTQDTTYYAVFTGEAHTYDEGKVTTQPTCTTEGVKTYTCSCGHTKTEKVDMLAHNYTVEVDGSRTPATCVETGSVTMQCANCTATTIQTLDTDKINHANIVTDAAVAPGCGSTGLTEGSHCEACDVVIVAQEPVSATGAHTYELVDYNWAEDGKSCTANGKCKDCDATTTATATISSAEKTAATCTAKGWTTYTATFAEEYKDWTTNQTKDVQDIAINSANHTQGFTYTDNGNGTHSATYDCCKAPYVTDAVHSYTDGKCVCGNVATYTVTWKDEAGNTVGSEEVTHGENADQVPAVPDKPGYTGAWSGSSDNITGNIIITPTYTPNNYSISWVVDGEKYEASVVVYDTVIALPGEKPTKTGYTFQGWYTEADGKGTRITDETIYNFETVTAASTAADEDFVISGNTSIYAHFTVNTYTVTFTINGAEYEKVPFTYGATVTAPEYTVPEGYDFSGWVVPATMPAENISLNATQSLKEYTVTWIADGKTQTTQVKYGDPIEAPADPVKVQVDCTTYTFAGWEGYTAGMTMPANENLTFTAKFIEGESHEWGTVSYQWSNDNQTCTATRPCNTNSDHNLTATATNISSQVTTLATCIAEGTTTYTATFEGVEWAVARQTAAQNVAIDPENHASQNVYYNNITDNTHEEHRACCGELVETANHNYDEATHVCICEDVENFTITFDTDGGNAIEPITQDYGTAVTAPADPTKSGYTFAGWNPEIPVTMPAEDLTVKAQWTATAFKITYSGVEDATHSNQGGYNVENLPLTLTDAAKENYVFQGWTCAELNITTPTKGLVIPEGTAKNLTIEAHFVEAVASLTSDGTTSYYTTLGEAWKNAGSDDTINLLSDTTEAGLVIDKDITIDFGGHTYTVNSAVGSSGTETLGLQILAGNDVTLKNGTITANDGVNAQGKVVKMLIQNYADLTLDDMTLTANANTLYCLSVNSGNAVINKSTITAAEGKVAFDVCKYGSYTAPVVTATECNVTGIVEVTGGELTVNGGTYTSNKTDVFVVDSGLLTIDGNVTVDGGGAEATTAVWAKNEGKVVIKDGDFKVSANDGVDQGYNDLIYARDNAVIEIAGGTFNGPARTSDGQKFLLNLKDNSNAKFIVKGGTYVGFDPQDSGTEPAGVNDDFTADGYIAVNAGNGTYTVVAHDHAYTYIASGVVLTEKCTSECRHSATAKLVLDSTVILVYSGSEIKPYTAQYADSWAGNQPTVQYENNVNAGTATVKLTVGSATASASFAIAKADLTNVSVSQSGTLTYNTQAQAAQVSTAATAVNDQTVTFTYSTAQDGTYGAAVPAFTNAGTYTVYYKATAPNHNEASGSFAVTIEKATPAYTIPTGITAASGLPLSQVTLPSAEHGSWNWVDANAVVGQAGEGIYQVTYTPADTDNYNSVTVDVMILAFQPTITFANTGDTVINPITADYGTAVTAPAAPTKTGYTFAGWDKEIPATMPAEDVTITARWIINQYTITFDTDGGTAIDAIKQDYNTAVEKPADPTKEGYTFAGWEPVVPATMPAEDVTITAKWTVNQYKAVFNAGEGKFADGSTSKEVMVNYGETPAAPDAPTKTGYTFTGWTPELTTMGVNGATYTATYTAADVSYNVETYTMDVNGQYGEPTVETKTAKADAKISVTAAEVEGFTVDTVKSVLESIAAADGSAVLKVYYSRNQYTFKTIVDGVESAADYYYGAEIEKPSDPTKEGHSFAGWNKDIPDTMPAENVTVTATWTVNKYTVTWDTDGSTWPISYAYGAEVNLPFTVSRTGYTLEGWYNGDEKVALPFNMPAKDITLKAKWTANVHTVTWNVDGKTTSENVAYGTAITLPEAPTKEGHTFTGWEGYTEGMTMPDEDVTFTAQWSVNSYKITLMDGETTVLTIFDNYGDTLYLSNSRTKEGHTFTGWNTKADGTGENFTDSLVIPAHDMTLYAQWEVNTYKVTLVDGTWSMMVYDCYGDTLTLYVTRTKEGHTFAGWNTKEDGSGDTITNSLVIPAHDVTLYAQWEVNQYTITFDTDGGSAVEAITQDYNTTVTAPDAPTKTGYTFAGWDKEIPATMPAEDVTITARWTINQYTITFDTDGGTAIDAIKQDYNTAVVKPADPSKEGYTFAGWEPAVPATMPAEDVTITAKWTVNQYKAVFNAGEGKFADGSTSKEVMVNYGETPAAPEEPTKTGYIFTGWTPELTTMGVNGATYTATYTAADVSYTVETYTMDVNGQYGEPTVETKTAKADAKISVTAAAKTGFTMDTAKSVLESTAAADGSAVLKVYYSRNQYKLTFYINGEQYGNAADVYYGAAITAPDYTVPEGYSFSGWSVSETMPAEDVTYYATRTANTYTVTWNVDDNTFDTTTQTYDTNLILPETKPTKTGYTFTGWADAEGNKVDETTKFVNANNETVYYAQWEVNTYTVTWLVDGKTHQTTQVKYGDPIEAPEDPVKAQVGCTTYTFAGWEPEIPATMPAQEDLSFTAEFTEGEKHAWGTVTYVFAEDGSACTATRPCNTNSDHNLTATAEITFAVKTPATCTAKGWTTYTATFAVDWAETQTKDVQDIAEQGHNWGETTYQFAQDGKSCTAERVCTRDASHKETAAAEISAAVKTAATCTEKGWTTYTATFTEDWAATQTKDVQDITEQGHNWGETTYNFAEDGKTCTAEHVCTRDASHKENATAEITSAVKTAATCTAKGWTTYTATFTEDWAATQTKDVEDITELGHAWGEVTYQFAENGKSCTAKRVCGNDETHIETATAEITSQQTKNPTCVDKGETTYTATFNVDWAEDQTKTVADVDALDHAWGAPSGYTDNEDGTHTAHYVCGNDASHTKSDEPAAHSYDTDDHICVCGDVETFTVTFTIDGAQYGETVTVEYGAAVTAPDYQVPEGHTFSGWTVPETMPAENITLNATLTVNTYKVTFTVNGEEYQVIEVAYGAAITVPKYTTPTGYTFSGWTVPETMPAGDQTYDAALTAKLYTLRFTRSNGRVEVANSVQVPYGAKIADYLPESVATYYENVANAKGKNEFLTWTYAVTGGYQSLEADKTMPAANLKLIGDYLFTGWSRDDNGWTYQVEDVVQKTGWTQIHEADFTEKGTGSDWYYLDPTTGYRAVDAVRVPYPTTAVNGNTYAPDQDAIDYAAGMGQTFIDAEEGWFLFGTDGKFQSDTTGMGTYYGATRYVVKGFFMWHPGLVIGGENYYYFTGDTAKGGNVMATGDVYVTSNMTQRNVKLGGVYTFGADGKLCEYNGITDMDNGTKRYYIDARLMMGNGLTKIGDQYIYVRTSGELVVNAEYWVPANDLNVVEGMYAFDEDGFMINPVVSTKDGIYYENGAWVYYEDGVIGYNKGLISVTEDWINGDDVVSRTGAIYVRSNGQLATGTYYVTNITDTTLGVESGDKVAFDANGLMIVMKNGIVAENGSLYYYVDNIIAYNAGVIKIGENYYYVRSNGEVVNNRSYWITNVGDTGVVAKNYVFDANGVMQNPEFTTKNGIIDGYYYVNGSIAYAAGVVYLENEGCYIYVRSSGQLATGEYWPTNTNGLLESKLYDWGEDGKLYL